MRGRDLKKLIIDKIKLYNPDLYTLAPGAVDVILMCMRPKVSDRARHAGEVIETIDTLCGHGSGNGLQSVIDEVGRLNDTLRDLQEQPLAQNPIIQRVVLRSIRSLLHDAQTLRSQVFNIDGDRESFVNGLLACVGTLGMGDELRAVTSTRFWRKENFGPYGRLTSMLIAAAMRGAVINWQLLVDPEHADDDQVVLLYQRASVEEYMYCAKMDSDTYSQAGLYCVGYHKVTLEDLRRVRRERETFILLRKGDRWTLVAAAYSDEQGGLSVVHLWDEPTRRQVLCDSHARWAAAATPITSYMFPGL